MRDQFEFELFERESRMARGEGWRRMERGGEGWRGATGEATRHKYNGSRAHKELFRPGAGGLAVVLEDARLFHRYPGGVQDLQGRI